MRPLVKPALYGEEICAASEPQPVPMSRVCEQMRKDGDEWVINGQKVWTSGAHFCDYGIIVTRSDPTVPKHKGLTFFFST